MRKRYCVLVGFQLTPTSPVEIMNGPRCFFFRWSARRWLRNMRASYLSEPHFQLWIERT